LNLTGWVRNKLDDRVEILAEGSKESLKSLLDYASQGPSQAYVTDIDLDWIGPSGKYSGFYIAPSE
jgi:acylphosphatase